MINRADPSLEKECLRCMERAVVKMNAPSFPSVEYLLWHGRPTFFYFIFITRFIPHPQPYEVGILTFEEIQAQEVKGFSPKVIDLATGRARTQLQVNMFPKSLSCIPF